MQSEICLLVPDVPSIVRQGHGWRSVSRIICWGRRKGGRREHSAVPESFHASTFAIPRFLESWGQGLCVWFLCRVICPGPCRRCCGVSGIIRRRRVKRVRAVGFVYYAVSRSSKGSL